jgi:hypothetical protein
MSLGCLHVNDGEEFKRFLHKNSQKCRSTDWPTPNGSES